MKYIIRKNVLSIVPEIEITEDNFNALKEARITLSSALAIEEKYDILLTNYIDLENELLTTATHHMVRENIKYSEFYEIGLRINTCLVNLLTAAKLYTDQIKQDIKKCISEYGDQKNSINTLFSNEYDSNKEYRFMEQLRNHVQHSQLPLHWTQFYNGWTSLDGTELLEHSTKIASQRKYLEENKKFKKIVLDELDEMIDLKSACRVYVESFSNIQNSVRELISDSVLSARKLIEDVHQQYSTINEGNLIGVSACVYSNDKQVSSIELLLDWDDIRIKLQKRNPKLANLRKRYVSGRI